MTRISLTHSLFLSRVELRVFDACIVYGYEYQGNFTRLVMTPLTERAFRSIACAMSIFRGSALSGPAGTGKTETVRDFAKALGANCVVCNCSKGLHYEAIVRFLRGICQTGAWGCFDECNRLDVGVLSTLGQVRLNIHALTYLYYTYTYK